MFPYWNDMIMEFEPLHVKSPTVKQKREESTAKGTKAANAKAKRVTILADTDKSDKPKPAMEDPVFINIEDIISIKGVKGPVNKCEVFKAVPDIDPTGKSRTLMNGLDLAFSNAALKYRGHRVKPSQYSSFDSDAEWSDSDTGF